MSVLGLLIYWGIYGAPVVIILLMLLVVLGVTWIPFGVTICAWMANKKQLPVLKFAIAGALFSLFLLLPWFYLITRMIGKELPRFAIKSSYVLIYISWLFGPILFYSWILIGSIDLDPIDEFRDETFRASITSAFMTVTGMLLWVVSIVRLRIVDKQALPSRDILPRMEYIAPFAFVLGFSASILPAINDLGWVFIPVWLLILGWFIYPLIKQMPDVMRTWIKRCYADIVARLGTCLHRYRNWRRQRHMYGYGGYEMLNSPLDLSAGEIGANELTVRWYGIRGLTYEACINYGIYHRTESDFQDTFYGLAPGTSYRISIRAVSKYGARGTPTTIYLSTAEVKGRHQAETSD